MKRPLEVTPQANTMRSAIIPQYAWATMAIVLMASAAWAALPQLPKAAVAKTFIFAPKDPSTHEPLRQSITFTAAEGLSSLEAATQLCEQLDRAPSLQAYNLTGILSNCIEDISHVLDQQRGRQLTVDPKVLKAFEELDTALTSRARISTFPPNFSQDYAKLAFLQNLMHQQPNWTKVCLVGFGAGHTAAAYFALRDDIDVVAFDLGNDDYVIPAHDFLDNLHSERLTLYLGDTGVTVPRFTLINPEFRCDIVHIDQSASTAAMRMGLVDFRAAVDVNDHIVLVDTSASMDALNVTRTQQQLDAFRQFGTLTIHGKITEPSVAEPLPYIHELIMAAFTSAETT